MAAIIPALSIDMPMRPWRLSGTVYGAAESCAGTGCAGDAANACAIQGGAQSAPVLFVKPRNTLLAAGRSCARDGDACRWVGCRWAS